MQYEPLGNTGLEFTAFSFKDPQKAAAMFAEDGAFEIQYLTTSGLPERDRMEPVYVPAT
jgi:hypothetical protein